MWGVVGHLSHRAAVAILLFGALFTTFSVVPVGAADFTLAVTTTADSNNACATTGAGDCSLRDAIRFANTKAASDTTVITLPRPTAPPIN